MVSSDLNWGIDLGGTKIELVILRGSNAEQIEFRERIATEADQGFEHIIQRIGRIVDIASTKTGLKPEIIGIGTPGALDPESGLLKNSNTTCLNGQPFKKALEQELELPIVIANDANCFALAETKMGSVIRHAPEAKVVFGVIMGTGVGGGLIVNGQPIGGLHGIGGEWGHIYLDDSGGQCYCGQIGCVETVISGSALQKYYTSLTGHQLSLKQIVREVENEDQAAVATVDRLVHFFGRGLATVINIVDPDVVVLGGGVGNIDALYSRGVQSVRDHVFNPSLDTVFLKPELGDSAGVFGAALLVAK